MKAAILIKPGLFQVQEETSPPLGRREVRIGVARAGICGSDVNRFRGGLPWAQFPQIPGHEFSGTVLEVGAGASFQPGQKVTVMPVVSCGECALCLGGQKWRCSKLWLYGGAMPGAYAEEVVVADDRVRLLPDYMSLDEGAFVEPLAVVMHVLNRAQLKTEDTVAVLGAGVIGMLAIQELAARRSRFIMATGRVEKKLSLARSFGASLVINDNSEDVVKKGLDAIPDGFDVILDFVCSERTVNQAITLGRPGARIVLIAAPHSEHRLGVDYASIYRKEMTLAASRLYSDEEFDQALSSLTRDRIQVAPIITARFKLSETPQAMDFVVNNRQEAIKVFIEP